MLGCLLQVKLGHRCLQYQRYTGHLHRWWRISQLCLVTMAFLGHRRLGLEGCFPKEPFIRLLFCCFECQECLSKPWAGEGGRKDEECLSCLFQEQAACRKEADALLPCSLCLPQCLSKCLHKLSWEGIFVSYALLSHWVLVGAGQLVEPYESRVVST